MHFWRHAGDIHGLAGRREYWTATIINMLVFVVMASPMWIWMLASQQVIFWSYRMFNTPLMLSDSAVMANMGLLFLFLVVIIVPSVTLFIRRLHDAGAQGLYFCLGFIPVVGLFFRWVTALVVGFVPHGGYHASLLAWDGLPIRELRIGYSLTWVWVVAGILTGLTMLFWLFAYQLMMLLLSMLLFHSAIK